MVSLIPSFSFPNLAPLLNLAFLIEPAFFILGIFSILFLFWRAGRHELVDSQSLFDLIIVACLGAVLASRIFDFIINWQANGLRFERLVFFNVYGHFDSYGAVVGAIVSIGLFLRKKKENLWFILDLSASPIIFGITLINLGQYLNGNASALDFTTGYFLIFWSLKRLEKRKRHLGFFACIAAVSALSLNILIYLANVISKNGQFSIIYLLNLKLLLPFVLLISSCVYWYILSKRNPKYDFKNILATLLLTTFKIRRIFTKISEADDFAKIIVMSPFYLARLLYFSGRIVFVHFLNATRDLIQVLGIKRFTK